jgi:hypothetical protein
VESRQEWCTHLQSQCWGGWGRRILRLRPFCLQSKFEVNMSFIVSPVSNKNNNPLPKARKQTKQSKMWKVGIDYLSLDPLPTASCTASEQCLIPLSTFQFLHMKNDASNQIYLLLLCISETFNRYKDCKALS